MDFARLYRFTAGSSLLCHSRQRQSRLRPPKLPESRQDHRPTFGSDDRSDWLPNTSTAISRSIAANRIAMPRISTNGSCFLTNNLTLPALTIAQLYKCRWQVELFFKWIKAAPAYQGVLRNYSQCREDASLDRHIRLRPGRNHQKGTGNRAEI